MSSFQNDSQELPLSQGAATGCGSHPSSGFSWIISYCFPTLLNKLKFTLLLSPYFGQRGLLNFEGSWTSTAGVVLNVCALLNNSSFSTELFLHLWLWVPFVPPESAWLIGSNPLPARPDVARRAWAPHCYSVTQSCPTLCSHKEHIPGFPVLHFLPVFAQTHVNWVDATIQLSLPLSSSSRALHLSQYHGLFQSRT